MKSRTSVARGIAHQEALSPTSRTLSLRQALTLGPREESAEVQVDAFSRIPQSKPANLIAGPEIQLPTSGPAAMAHAHHDVIVDGVDRGLSAQRIW